MVIKTSELEIIGVRVFWFLGTTYALVCFVYQLHCREVFIFLNVNKLIYYPIFSFLQSKLLNNNVSIYWELIFCMDILGKGCKDHKHPITSLNLS